MELSRYELAAVKKTAQIVRPKRAKLAKLNSKRDSLDKEIRALEVDIELWEAPIITKHGYSSEQILSGEADEIAAQTENMPAAPEEVYQEDSCVESTEAEEEESAPFENPLL